MALSMLVLVLMMLLMQAAGRQLLQAAASCPADWAAAGAQVQKSGACLLLVKQATVIDWFSAEDVCISYGGHLAYATTAAEMDELKQLCQTGTKGLPNEGRCWLGARQQFSSPIPSAGWQWTDCTAQKNAPFDSVVPPLTPWGPGEPNDYNLATQSSDGTEGNRENCFKIEGGTNLQDYICAGPSDYVPQALICSPSRWCGNRQLATLVVTPSLQQCVCNDYDYCGKNPNPCNNNGVCVNTPLPGPHGREWACNCPKGWSGERCDSPTLKNGDFESAVSTDPSRNDGKETTYYAEGDSGVVNASWFDGWKVLSGSIDVVPSTYLQAATGKQSLDLNGGSPGLIYQSFNTVPGKDYFVNFALSGNPSIPQYGSPPLKTLRVLINNKPTNSIGLFNYTLVDGYNSPTAMHYKNINYRFTATRTRTNVAFQSTTPGACGPVIDSVFISGAL